MDNTIPTKMKRIKEEEKALIFGAKYKKNFRFSHLKGESIRD